MDEIESNAYALACLMPIFDGDSVPGFDYVGSGWSRIAFRRGDYVYKVHTYEGDDEGCNVTEAIGYDILSTADLPQNVRIPATCLFVFENNIKVIVQDFIEGHIGYGNPYWNEIAMLGIWDTAGNNTIYDGEFYWPVDLASLGDDVLESYLCL